MWRQVCGLLLGVALCAAGSPVAAQDQPQKVAIQIDANAADPVGRQLAFYLRDEIGRSGTLGEVPLGYGKGLRVELVTLDPLQGVDGAGKMTIYSFVILGKNPAALDYYLNSYVGSCTIPKACAETLFGSIGQQIEELRQALRESR
jgi:hypothetical protein